VNGHRVGAAVRLLVPRGADNEGRGAPSFAGAWPLAILLLLATLPYVGTLWNDFAYAYDDKAQIIDNPYAHSFRHMRETLTTTVWSYKSAQDVTNYYRPMTSIGFLLCYQVFGPLAYGFHLASLLLHTAVVAILFLVAERIFRDRGGAFAAAGLFALHPIHVESVAWISALTDVEVTFFYLLTFWCFLRVGGLQGGRNLWAQAAMTASFLLTLLSKEQALTLPSLAMIYEHIYREDRAETARAQKLLRYAPLWLLSLGYILMRVRLLGSFARTTGLHQLTAVETFLSAFALAGQYLSKLLWPARLSAFYVFQASTKPLEPPVLEGVGALIVCAVVFGAAWRRARPASFGILWLFVTLAPVLNARWMGAYVFAERYAYLPSVGFCLVAGWACATLWQTASRQRTVWRRAVVAAACVVAALGVLRIVTRVHDWRDDVTLLTRTLAAGPNEYRLHDGLGLAYWMRGDPEAAECEWREALRLKPNNVQALDLLGAFYAKQRRYDQALALLERAIRLDPNDADAHLNLGAAYAEMGVPGRAEEQFRAAVLLSPLNLSAHNVLGKLYFDSGRLSAAEEQFRQSLECEPNLAAYDHLGYIYQRWGDRDRAEKAFRAALAFNPADSHAHFNLGLIYAAAGQKAQAAQEFRAALAADPGNPEVVSALEQLRR
jgi:Tfp pilus assembly protein PilF